MSIISHTSAPIDWQFKYQQLAQQAQHPSLQRFYQQLPALAQQPIGELELVALDIETTGLDSQIDEIISIGLVPFNTRRIRLKERRYWLLRPRQKLAAESVVIHGITHNSLRNAPDLDEVFEEMLTALTGKVVVVHCHSIERQFLAQALQRRIGEGILFPIIDTLKLEARIQAKQWRHLWRSLFGRQRPSLRLAQCRSRYGLPLYPPHHALTDAIACAELFQAQIAHHYSHDHGVEKLWL